MILIAALVSVASTVFAKTQALNCIVGLPGKLQMVSIVVDSKAKRGIGNITLYNLDKARGWMPFKRAETTVAIQYTINASTGGKNIIGATVNMGKSGFVSIKPISIMNNSIYANLTAQALGFNYPQGENVQCESIEKSVQ